MCVEHARKQLPHTGTGICFPGVGTVLYSSCFYFFTFPTRAWVTWPLSSGHVWNGGQAFQEKMKSTDNDLDNRRWQSAVDDFSGGGREREGERGAKMEASHPIMLMTMMPLVSHLLSPFPHFLIDMRRVLGSVLWMGGENEGGEQEKPVTPRQPARYLERDPPLNLLLGSAKLKRYIH